MNANLVFETLNGAWTIALLYVVVFVLIYLYTAMREQGTRAFMHMLFFDRPQAEQLAIAIMISDVGNMIVRGSTWIWRNSGLSFGPLDGPLFWGVIVGAVIGTVGILCKLRVISIVRFGHWPWVTCALVIALLSAWEIFVE